METTDKIFIDNNICSIHDRIINALIDIRERIIDSKNNDGLMNLDATLDEIESLVLQTREAKDKGIKIESRLKKYLYTIRALGFTREPEAEELTVIDNKLRLISKRDIEDNIDKPERVDE